MGELVIVRHHSALYHLELPRIFRRALVRVTSSTRSFVVPPSDQQDWDNPMLPRTPFHDRGWAAKGFSCGFFWIRREKFNSSTAEPTPCSPLNAASKTTTGSKSSIEGFSTPQPPNQKIGNYIFDYAPLDYCTRSAPSGPILRSGGRPCRPEIANARKPKAKLMHGAPLLPS